MPSAQDAWLEKLIAGTEEVVAAVESLGLEKGPRGPLDDVAAPAAEEISSAVFRSAPVRDGNVDIVVSDDAMTVEADFHPPSSGGAPLTLEDVQMLLRRRGIKRGVDWTVVTDGVERCANECLDITGVVIARGDAPVDEIPEHIVLEPSLLDKPAPTAQGDQPVDYRSWSPFRLVKAGEILGHLIPKEPGALGTNVRGEAVPYKKRRVETATVGHNVTLEGADLVAKKDGRFQLATGAATVSEVLRVPGDVDYSTGHIDFPGDVMVEGQVKQGFNVRTGGSLHTNRVIAATEVICGADLITPHGILGRGIGVVKVAGEIHAGFIEHCYIEAKKSIHVRIGCLNCVVNTQDQLIASGKGVIVGGTIVAANGVIAGQVGTASGSRTEIRCGIDFAVNRKLEWLRDSGISLAGKLKEIERKIAAKNPPDERLVQLRQRVRAAIRTLAESARSLASQLDRNENAEVVVSGTVHPGTYIEICRVPFVVERPLNRVHFALVKESGRVAVRPIDRRR